MKIIDNRKGLTSRFKLVLCCVSSFEIISCNTANITEVFTDETRFLQFEEVLEFESNEIEGFSMGMTSNTDENAIYIASRDDYPLVFGTNREQIIKVDLASLSYQEKISGQSDFITKHLSMENGELISMGGQYLRTYDLGLNNEPIIEPHGKSLSFYGFVKGNGTNYIIGGDLEGVESNKIFKWSSNEPQTFEEFIDLPKPVYGASGIVVEDRLLLFGGSKEPSGEDPSNQITSISIVNAEIMETYTMSMSLFNSFVRRIGDSVLVAGRDSSLSDSNDITIGVFDLSKKQFSKLATNLRDFGSNKWIGQMVVLENTIYVMYGYVRANPLAANEIESEWSLMNTKFK